MVVSCVIEFDNNPYETYFAGQVVTGKITLQVDKAKQVKGVVLKINGYAYTRWHEGRRHNSNSSYINRSHTYTGREDYIASTTYLLGSEENQSIIIEPGVHTYNFACHIPNTCPSSFEGQSGHIRYTVKVSLIRPWKFDQTFTRGFTVLKVLDLNYDTPLLRVPADSEVQSHFCCGPCKSDPLKIHVNLPQSGYVPGQTISVTILVTNDTALKIEEIKVALVMLVCYYSTSPHPRSKNNRIVVTKLKGEPVLRQTKKLFNYTLNVPATPPTCYNVCRLIQIVYQVEVEAKVKGCHANQVVCVPVTIGNVPLTSIVQQQPTSSTSVQPVTMDITAKAAEAEVDDKRHVPTDLRGIDSGNQKPIPLNGSNGPITLWSAGSNLPPPSYEEALHVLRGKINEDEAHDYGQSEFTPRYPVFNIPSPTAPSTSESDAGFSNGSTDPGKNTWL